MSSPVSTWHCQTLFGIAKLKFGLLCQTKNFAPVFLSEKLEQSLNLFQIKVWTDHQVFYLSKQC
jgi:hypothetical protein